MHFFKIKKTRQTHLFLFTPLEHDIVYPGSFVPRLPSLSECKLGIGSGNEVIIILVYNVLSPGGSRAGAEVCSYL